MCRAESSPAPPHQPMPRAMPIPTRHAKITKPRLPRCLATSARINLNRYWHALEVLMPATSIRRPFDEADANAINDNIDNERRLSEMRLAETEMPPTEMRTEMPPAEMPLAELGETYSGFFKPPTPTGTADFQMESDENTPPAKSSGSSR